LSVETFVCSGCSEPANYEGLEECCYNEDDSPIAILRSKVGGFAIVNTNTGDYIKEHTLYASGHTVPDFVGQVENQSDVCFWHDEADANGYLDDLDYGYDSKYGHENRHGFPWARNTAFLPATFIKDWMLMEAGFVVATYQGGSHERSWENESYRLCGIDGGGYSFGLSHYVSLFTIVHEANDWTVETELGEVLVTSCSSLDEYIARKVNQ